MHLLLPHETADWVNRVGMLLGFVAFWFAAPELIGEQRLLRWEHLAEQGVRLIPKGFEKVPTILGLLGFVGSRLVEDERGALFLMAFALVSVVPLTILQVVFERSLGPWLLRVLAHDERIRARSLFLGAALFTLSFILQFASTFQAPAGH
jgi:hypothetical protein